MRPDDNWGVKNKERAEVEGEPPVIGLNFSASSSKTVWFCENIRDRIGGE